MLHWIPWESKRWRAVLPFVSLIQIETSNFAHYQEHESMICLTGKETSLPLLRNFLCFGSKRPICFTCTYRGSLLFLHLLNAPSDPNGEKSSSSPSPSSSGPSLLIALGQLLPIMEDQRGDVSWIQTYIIYIESVVNKDLAYEIKNNG